MPATLPLPPRRLWLAALLALLGAAPVQAATPLSEAALARVSAQGLTQEGLLSLVRQAQQGQGADLLALLAPWLSFLSAEVAAKDVVYDPAALRSQLHEDGSVTVRLPSSVGEVAFNRLRVAGETDGAAFGSLMLRSIDFGQTTITLRSQP